MSNQKNQNSDALGICCLLGLFLVFVSSGSLLPGLFFLGAIFFGLPYLWIHVICKTFDGGVQRFLFLVAALFIICCFTNLLGRH